MKLTNLISLYEDMKDKKITYTIFDYKYNKVKIEVLFDIVRSPFFILLIKSYSKLSLKLYIEKGFIINTFLNQDDYNKLREILEIPNGKENKFLTNDFFENFNSKIPNLAVERDISHETRKSLSNMYNCEYNNKIYLLGFTDWSDKKNGHYTKKNREKVRILYPQIYETIRDKNISIKFTDNQKYKKNLNFSDLKEVDNET